MAERPTSSSETGSAASSRERAHTGSVQTTQRRPAELTAAVVLTYISAFVEIIVGVLVILLRYVPDISDDLKRFITIAGAAGILIGFLTVAVASGIARGDRHARIVLTVLLSLGAALSIVSAFSDASDLPVTLTNAVVSVGLIVVLWTGRARAYFARANA